MNRIRIPVIVVEMIAIWRFSERRLANLTVILCLLNGNLDLCWSLNDEGMSFLVCFDFGLGRLNALFDS